MVWDHIDVTKTNLVYIILGGFTSLFMLCSSVIKERMYIGEATVATLVGVIFGPHAANLINPESWGGTDRITIEFSRIVLVVQCFAVGVELPKFYMEKHWRSVIFLLVPVMTFGWLIVSVFIFWMIPPLNWLDSLVVAACVTATDPVLASSVVGKGKFAKRVPKHLRDLLSAESGCNDGMAFPFIYLSLYLIQFNRNAGDVSFHFVVYVVLYECIFGAIYGFVVGYIARHGIKYAESHDLVDRESFLVFYFVLALFCAGSGNMLGVDDLLVGFAAGVGFSNDGWFGEKTEESHVSNVIDLLLNLAYFVYFGTIIPWEQYNSGYLGVHAWRLVVIAVFVIFFRRIPIMMALKPFIPDIKTWREALFAGHFGPIGVGAIFVAIMARSELQHESPIPLSQMPSKDDPHYSLIYLVWPVVTFLVITSILVHGSSVAVFTLGKRINTLTLTMSYTAAPDDGPSWMNRLPRISSQSRSQARTSMSEASFEKDQPRYPPETLMPPYGSLLRQQRDSDNGGSRPSSIMARKRRSKKWETGMGPGGPVSQSAIFPQRQPSSTPMSPVETPKDVSPSREHTDSTLAADSSGERESGKHEEGGSNSSSSSRRPSRSPHPVEVYDEGENLVFEDEEGEVIDVQPAPEHEARHQIADELPLPATAAAKAAGDKLWTLGGWRKKMSEVYNVEVAKRKEKAKSDRKHEPARAYQFGNTIIVEDEDGEVVKTYALPSQRGERAEASNDLLKYVGLGGKPKPVAATDAAKQAPEKDVEAAPETAEASGSAPAKTNWTSFGGLLGNTAPDQAARRQSVAAQQMQDDKNIRFTIGGVGQRMTKEDFIREVQKLDSRTRREVVDQSSASQRVKTIAKQDLPSINIDQPSAEAAGRPGSGYSSDSVSPGRHPRRINTSKAPERPSEEMAETAVERKRRLAVLATQEDDDAETPAERRRREAALGMGAEDDSDDEGDARVPPAERRGITFAEPTRADRGRKK